MIFDVGLRGSEAIDAIEKSLLEGLVDLCDGVSMQSHSLNRALTLL